MNYANCPFVNFTIHTCDLANKKYLLHLSISDVLVSHKKGSV